MWLFCSVNFRKILSAQGIDKPVKDYSAHCISPVDVGNCDPVERVGEDAVLHDHVAFIINANH